MFGFYDADESKGFIKYFFWGRKRKPGANMLFSHYESTELVRRQHS